MEDSLIRETFRSSIEAFVAILNRTSMHIKEIFKGWGHWLFF